MCLPGPAVRKRQTPPVRMESRQVSICASLLQGGCGASGRPPGPHGELQSYEEVAVGPVWTLRAPPAPFPRSQPHPRATSQVLQALAGGGGARRVTMRKQPVCRGPLAGTGRAAETMRQHRAPGGVGEVCAPGHRDAGGVFDNQTGAHSISGEDPGQTEQRASLSPDAVDPPLASAPGGE